MVCMDIPESMHNPDFITDSTHLQDIVFFDDVGIDSYSTLIHINQYLSMMVLVLRYTFLLRKVLHFHMLDKHMVLSYGIHNVNPHFPILLDVVPSSKTLAFTCISSHSYTFGGFKS